MSPFAAQIARNCSMNVAKTGTCACAFITNSQS
jgi:hypothetical protein